MTLRLTQLATYFSGKKEKTIGRLVMTRHGQSVWNNLNRWAGWTDVRLSEKGIEEARQAGIRLKGIGFVPDVVYTSMLTRTIQTFNNIADSLDCHCIPITKTWRLNQKHYGDLQGKNRKDVVGQYGQEQVKVWRRSYDVAPPLLPSDDPRHPSNDKRYKDVDKSLLPVGQSLKDTIKRVKPVWDEYISKDLLEGKDVLVVAHGNTVRSLMKQLDNISDKDIVGLNVPTAIPILYQFDENLRVLKRQFLEDAQILKKKQQQMVNQASSSKKV